MSPHVLAACMAQPEGSRIIVCTDADPIVSRRTTASLELPGRRSVLIIAARARPMVAAGTMPHAVIFHGWRESDELYHELCMRLLWCDGKPTRLTRVAK